MFHILSRLLEQILVGGCMLSLNLLFAAVIAVFRISPFLFHSAGSIVRSFLVLSIRVYKLIVSSISSRTDHITRLNLLTGGSWVVSSLVLSLGFSIVSIYAIGLKLTPLFLAPGILHGLIVGFLSDEIDPQGGLRLGVPTR